jgi:hypothetical protein
MPTYCFFFLTQENNTLLLIRLAQHRTPPPPAWGRGSKHITLLALFTLQLSYDKYCKHDDCSVTIIEYQLCSIHHKYTVLLLKKLHLYVHCASIVVYLMKVVGGGVRTCVHFLSGVEGPIFRSAEYAMRAHVTVLAQDRKKL